MNPQLAHKTSSFVVKKRRNSTLLPALFALKLNIFDARYLPWRLLRVVQTYSEAP